MWIWLIGCGVLFCKTKWPLPDDGSALGEDVDVGIDCNDLGLRNIFILFEVPFVVSLDVPAIFCGEVLVEDVGVVEVPRAAADGDDEEESCGGDEAGCTLASQTDARGPCVVRAAAGERDGDNGQDAGDR